MKNTIDCLIIGHNETAFDKYVKDIEKMGVNSGAYRDLNLSFIRDKGRPYHAGGIFNLITGGGNFPVNSLTPIRDGESFSAAVAYLGTYLSRRGLTFDYVNSFQSGREELKEKLVGENILSIAITTTLYVSVFPIVEIVNFIKTYNSTAKVIVGGPFISTQCRVSDPMTLKFLFDSIGADVYVDSSQGEAALVGIVNAFKKGFPLDNINNIRYKSEAGYIAAPILKENNILSENMVNWELFSDRIGEYVNLRTAVSCPFSCSFCGFPEHAGKYQTAEIEAIERELNLLRKNQSVKSLHFIDDTFNVPVERFKNLLRMMIKNKYQFKWHSQFRCQFMDGEMVELMKESGCEGVFLGIESGNDGILKNMNKIASVEKYQEGIALLKEYEIVTYGSFIVGFPGETPETAADTVNFIKESGMDFYRTQLWYCEPITPIWRQREKYEINGSHFEWRHSSMNSKEAADIIDQIFLSVEDPIWLPQYGFDFNSLFHLTNRGLSWTKVKNFIRCFNSIIREKLAAPSRKEMNIHDDAFNRLKNALIYEREQSREPARKRAEQQDDLIIDFDLD